MLIRCLVALLVCLSVTLPTQAQTAQAAQAKQEQASAAESSADTKNLSYDARLSNYDYALPVETYTFSSQGQPLEMTYVYLKGEGDKPVVTLLHGKNFNADYWAPTAKHLHAQGYGVLMPDQIGFGKSTKPVDYQYSFAALANNTRNLQASLNINKSIIVGHSMGGMLATRYALLFPEQTLKLILVNPIGLENYLAYAQYKDIAFFEQNELKQSAQKIKDYQRKNYYDGKWNDTYDKLTHFLIGQVNGPDWKQMAKVNALTYDMIFTQPVVTEFANISVPTTLILGTRDRTGPGRGWMRPGVNHELGRYDLLGKQTAAIIPHATLHEIEDSGHLPQLEKFEVFVKLLDETLAGE